MEYEFIWLCCMCACVSKSYSRRAMWVIEIMSCLLSDYVLTLWVSFLLFCRLLIFITNLSEFIFMRFFQGYHYSIEQF